MDDRRLQDQTCRVAFAAFLHDLGKLAERARMQVEESKRLLHEQMYCPRREEGGRVWHTHKHAAYTVLAWDLIERCFPELIGDDVSPFAAWGATDVDNSIVNAAGRHHVPDTFLQWIVATADRVASGFERETFEAYNQAEEKTRTGRNHYTARQLTLFEPIRLNGDLGNTRDQWHWRYPLKPLSPESLFPVEAKGYEGNDDKAAQAEYAALWDQFTAALESIPPSHRGNWPLWLDHFDAAWGCFTHAIPAATAFNVRPEVSLYDHSRTAAALAAALWRYHHESGDTGEDARKRLADRGRSDWDVEKLLLIQGDLFGIQDFIFATGGETQKRAAKLLRGRSFYIALLTECAALRILDALELPPTSQVINAAGKFLIVAPNTDRTRERLEQVQRSFDQWFLEHAYGQSGIGLAFRAACCNDFVTREGLEDPPFRALIRGLFEDLQTAKSQRLDLCGERPPAPIFTDFLDRFRSEMGVCAIDGRSPATEPLEKGEGRYACALSNDQIRIGGELTRRSRVLISTESLGDALRVPVLGYHIQFTGDEERSGRFGAVAQSGVLRRVWDFGLPATGSAPMFHGYARREIDAHVPTYGTPNDWERQRYAHLDADQRSDGDADSIKTLGEIACDDLVADAEGRRQGTEALMTLKGDVDDLGRIFERGLETPSFAKMAGLSRQLNAFFAVWLPWVCRERYPSTYTVFAGGDDFYLIGPWRSTIALAAEMRREFARFVAANPEIHFSAGLVMTKPGLPIRQMGQLAEEQLEAAKAYRWSDGATSLAKNAVTCFGHTVSWAAFTELARIADALEVMRDELALSTGYLYGLQSLADMAEDLRRAESDPTHSPRIDSALWPSRFAYRTWRMLESKRGLDLDARRRWQQTLGQLLGDGIRKHGSAFKIALFIHLYHHRR
jgi:CRISPR-associated protein Csm1